MIFARRSRSDSAWPAIARFMLSGKTTSLTSTAVTLIPHGSVCRSMISCSLRFILSRWESSSSSSAEHAAQRCLRNERSRFQVVLHSHDRSRWIDDAKINDGVNGHRYVVPCHDFLARDVDGHDAQIHPHHAIDDPNEENQSGPFCAEQLAETENHPALVLAQDADHLRQDDYGEENNGKQPDEHSCEFFEHGTSSSGFGFHFCRQSFDGNDLYGSSFFHQRIAGRIPIRLPQKLFPKFEDYSCFAPEVGVRESNQKEPRQFT